MKGITIGFQVAAHYGDIPRMREAWIEAEALGADRLYTSDHLVAVPKDVALITSTDSRTPHSEFFPDLPVFEAVAIQAAMAATTQRAQIGCICHASGFRNPNMMAFAASTIHRISNGRYILGMGTGYTRRDFEDFGFEYGTQTERSLRLKQDVDTILERYAKLQPVPEPRIPLLIATMGEKIGLRLVAEHADMWHAFGPYEKLEAKYEVLKAICAETGRDINEIEFVTNWWPQLLTGPRDNPDDYIKLGIRHIVVTAEGPDWDLGIFRELVAWRNALR